MINSIEQYLSELKEALSGCDRATIQDALSDAQEYLTTALNGAADEESGTARAEILQSIVEKYGTPEEVAAAYREIESQTPPAFTKPSYQEMKAVAVAEEVEEVVPSVKDTRPPYLKFFGVVAEPRAWGALIYLLFAMFTGIIYFTWVITGLSLSAGLLVLIIGLPIAGLFLLSVWGISLVEGRVVEALLGVRMPRRPLYYRKKLGFWSRIKTMLTDKHTWLSLIYMILQMPLGIFYFSLFVSLISVSLWGIVSPILQLGFDIPVIWHEGPYFFAGWFLPIAVISGILLLIITMHLAKLLGKVHGMLAKAMLVRI